MVYIFFYAFLCNCTAICVCIYTYRCVLACICILSYICSSVYIQTIETQQQHDNIEKEYIKSDELVYASLTILNHKMGPSGAFFDEDICIKEADLRQAERVPYGMQCPCRKHGVT